MVEEKKEERVEFETPLENNEETASSEEAFLQEEAEKQKELLLFVDRNPLYYERKWGKKENPSKGISWNFAAFFFSTFWFGYRKMYGWMFACMVLYALCELSMFGLSLVVTLS
jgi:hypothetical protein